MFSPSVLQAFIAAWGHEGSISPSHVRCWMWSFVLQQFTVACYYFINVSEQAASPPQGTAEPHLSQIKIVSICPAFHTKVQPDQPQTVQSKISLAQAATERPLPLKNKRSGTTNPCREWPSFNQSQVAFCDAQCQVSPPLRCDCVSFVLLAVSAAYEVSY